MLIKGKNQRQSHAIKILKIILDSKFNTHIVQNLLDIYGSKALYHRYLPNNDTFKGKTFLFKPNENLVLDYYLMKSKSKQAQIRINKYLISQMMLLGIDQPDTTLNNSHSINIYNGFFSGADSRLQIKKVVKNHIIRNRVIWTDKKNNKPTYKLLNSVKSRLNRQFNRIKGVQLLIGRIEEPHHLSQQRHIYGHGHYHFLIIIDSTKDTNKLHKNIRSKLTKDFVKEFNYNPSHVSIKPLYYYIYGNNLLASKNALQPVIYGKDSLVINKIPVKLSSKPKLIKIKKPKKLLKDNQAYLNNKAVFNTKNKNYIRINSNLLAFLTVDYFIQYIAQDYRLQIKDSDDFADNKKLSDKQKRLTFLADVNSGKNSSIINQISKSKVTKSICKALNLTALKQEKKLQSQVLNSGNSDPVHKSNKYQRTVNTINSSIKEVFMTYIDVNNSNIIDISLSLLPTVEKLRLFAQYPT